MSSTIHLDNIETYLFKLADLIENSNPLNRNNRTVDAENLFCLLLNTSFGWNLINANEARINQDSFDLIDKKKKLYIQVTSNKNHLRKFKSTVDGFKKKRNKNGSRLIVLFISRKCPAKILQKVKAKTYQYEAYDLTKLFREIYFKNKSPQKLREINELLEAEMTPVSILTEPKKKQGSFKLPIPIIKKRDTGLYINRKKLIEEVFSFGQIANGLLVGGPGIGKSFVIEELQRLCVRKQIPCVIIRINDLLEGTNEEIRENVGIESLNWIAALKKGYSKSLPKGFLIFDAFDSAKEERIKSLIIGHLQKAIKELEQNWTILVSARTFDASKSTRLLELFPQTNINKPVSCRYFDIPELSDDELLASVKADPKLYEAFQNSTPSLEKLLKVPYFLKLLEKILEGIGKGALSSIETEEQLLKVFWNKKVAVKSEADLFLQKLTNVLAVNENLSCRKDKVINQLNITIYDHLISLGILAESSITKQTITYSHNILLDYAISRYLIPEDSSELIAYVHHNPKMPFLFRQSFIYFYSRLWNIEITLFWKHYFDTRTKNEPVFRLFHQTILNYILGGFYTSVKQLNPVFSLPNPEERGSVIRKILEGVRFINKGIIRQKDYDLLLRAAKLMHESYIWELGYLIDRTIFQLEKDPNKNLQSKITSAALIYLRFILDERKTSSNKWLIDTNGGMWGVQNVCNTFSANNSIAKKLLKRVLLILKEDDFSIRFFYTVSNNILNLFRHDPEFGVLVYKTIYTHTEISEKETYLGGSPVMSLRSNRKQDFGSIYHRLEKVFPEILSLSPEIGIRLGLELVDRYTIQTKVSYKVPSFNLSVIGQASEMISDFFFHDSEHDKEYGPVSHLESIFKFFEQLTVQYKVNEVKPLIKVLVSSGKSSSIWRRLIKFLTANATKYKDVSVSLLLNEAIFVCNETVFEAGELLKATWAHLTAGEKKKIEKSIISLLGSKLLKEEDNLAIRRTQRLLSCVPQTELFSSELKDFMKVHGGALKNEPLIRYSGLQPYHPSDEERLRDAGVDPSNIMELKAYDLIKRIESFNDKYDYHAKVNPEEAEYDPLIPVVTDLWEICKTQNAFNKKLVFNCDYEVSRFARIISKNGNKLLKYARTLAENIGEYYINKEDYKEPSYESGEIKNRWGAYAPTPRTAATMTFVHLLLSDKSGKLAPIVFDLISDNKQIVRFKALHGVTIFWRKQRGQFWKIVEERIQKERDGMCLHELIKSVHYDDIIQENQKEVENTALLAAKNLFQEGSDPVSELWQMYIVVLLKLFVKYNSSIAENIIYDHLGHKSFSRTLVIEIITVLDPHAKENNYVTNPAKNDSLLKIVSSALNIRFANIHAKGLKNESIKDDFEIIDFCIQRLYFTVIHGAKPNKGKKLENQNRVAFYLKIKPMLSFVVYQSSKIGSGFMVAHTGYYFMQFLNEMLYADPEFILSLSSDIVKCAAANNFTYDQSTMQEIIKLTEKILADHKEILSRPELFDSLIAILDQFANSGWQEALELTWRLKEVF